MISLSLPKGKLTLSIRLPLHCFLPTPQPGGHLVLSTISRTPLAHLLTITFAESLLRLVSPGTHTSSKFVKPSELDGFFDSLSPTPWNDSRIPGYNGGGGVRESRGILYVPWKGKWELVGRNVGDVGRAVNYLYYVRKPKQI
jgi:polyprenyldihydroxybenzoate methyltransferase/3-demethylubiquinol 3-O-methyltransferase